MGLVRLAAGTRAIRSVLAETGRHAIDEIGFLRAQGFVAEAETPDAVVADVAELEAAIAALVT